MNARYWQKGETLDYTATEKAVTNGQVVSLGGRIGVAGNDIAKGETGALHVTGVFIMEKAASVTVTMGAALYFDESEEKITTVAAGKVPAGVGGCFLGPAQSSVRPRSARRQVTPPCWSISGIPTEQPRRWPPCMTAWR